jgi:hypothetical protein
VWPSFHSIRSPSAESNWTLTGAMSARMSAVNSCRSPVWITRESPDQLLSRSHT